MATKLKDVLGDSRKRYRARGQRQENPDRTKSQSDYGIRYRAVWEKNKIPSQSCDLIGS